MLIVDDLVCDSNQAEPTMVLGYSLVMPLSLQRMAQAQVHFCRTETLHGDAWRSAAISAAHGHANELLL